MTLLNLSAAPLNGETALPADLIDQHVKPTAAQAALVKAMRLAALLWLEKHTRHSVALRTWTATFDGFAPSIRLPVAPVARVTLIRYRDQGGAWVDCTAFGRMQGQLLRPVAPQGWSVATDLLEVTFEAGYDDLGAEAPELQTAAVLMLRHLFDGGSEKDAPATIGMLVDEGYRVPVMA